MSTNTISTNINNRESALCLYDLTINCDLFTLQQVIDWMQKHCKRWCFQKEEGSETGYIHYQCRVSLISRKRFCNMIEFIIITLRGAHVSATSNPTFYSGSEFYVMKEDTRIEGPWTDRNTVNLNNIPSRLREEPEWFPWQSSVLTILNGTPDDRTVNVIYNAEGGIGKSRLAMFLKCRKRAHRIPPMKEAKDIMRMVMDMDISTCYFIDLPRATNNSHQAAIYSAIEEIKNGYAYDDRYHFKDLCFEPPHIWVFTNIYPPVDMLSKGRWIIWTVDERMELIPFTQPEQQEPFRRYLNLRLVLQE